MRIKELEIMKVGPIKRVSVTDLSDVVVFAGPNGVGKTSLNDALLSLFRNPHPNESYRAIIEASSDEERQRWGAQQLDTRNARDCEALAQTLRRNHKRNEFSGSILNFDSSRSVYNVQNYDFRWDIGDPYAENISWDIGMNAVASRTSDVRHSLFRLVESQKREIAERALAMQREGTSAMSLDFPDVLAPFKLAFSTLLAPKQFVEVNTRNQQLLYSSGDTVLPFETLSSGEREVITVVFDFILRNPTDCVIIFDEPELHLHPELSFKLLQALSRVGTRNQFIFSTHSAEIISASLENTVVFVSPPHENKDNQAIVVGREDETHHALQTLGQSIGIISLGRRLVLVEGEDPSLDKQTYGAILKAKFPDLVLVPVGGKGRLQSFEDIRHRILDQTLWGVEFFLLCDRDAVTSLQSLDVNSSDRFRTLPRYHIENYFLSERILANAFANLEPAGSWLRSPDAIRDKLLEIARSVVPYAAALYVNARVRNIVGNVSLMPKGVGVSRTADELFALMNPRARDEQSRVSAGLDEGALETLISTEFERLTNSVSAGGAWVSELPGKIILAKFASTAGLQIGRLKTIYINAAQGTDAFNEVEAIFQGFSNVAKRN